MVPLAGIRQIGLQAPRQIRVAVVCDFDLMPRYSICIMGNTRITVKLI